MTTKMVLDLVQAKAQADSNKLKARDKEPLRKEWLTAVSASSAQAELARLKFTQLLWHAEYCSESVREYFKRVRPMRERVAIAKIRAANHHLEQERDSTWVRVS